MFILYEIFIIFLLINGLITKADKCVILRGYDRFRLEDLRGVDVPDYVFIEGTGFVYSYRGNGVFGDPLASTIPIAGLKSKSSMKITFNR